MCACVVVQVVQVVFVRSVFVIFSFAENKKKANSLLWFVKILSPYTLCRVVRDSHLFVEKDMLVRSYNARPMP